MSDQNSPQSGQTDANAKPQSGDQGAPEITANRTPEEYAARLVEVSNEAKKEREAKRKAHEELEKTRAELNAIREAKAKEAGDYKTMYEDLKAKFAQESEGRVKDKANFAFKTVTSQFAAEAAKLGCAKPDDLLKLATADGLINDLDVSESDFSVQPDSLKAAVERAQKSYGYLFAKPTPAVRDGVPNQNKQKPVQKPDLSSMKMEDLIKLAKQAK